MSRTPRSVIDENLAAVARKDVDAAVSGFAPNGVLIDPHYPRQLMTGRDEIAAGLRWVFGAMRELTFTIDRCFAGADGFSAAVEVTSDHTLRTGRPIHLQQAFVVDIDDGLITRWRAYEPYGPHGIAGLARRLAALRRR